GPTPSSLSPRTATACSAIRWRPRSRCSDVGEPRALELARKLVAKAPENGVNQRCLAMACCRAGDWKASVAPFKKTLELHDGAEAVDAFFLAIALCKLGRHGEARQGYDVGIGWLQEHRSRLAKETVFAEELRRLQAEAAQVLGVQKMKD